MARSVGKLLSGSGTEKTSFPLTQSLLAGIKRGLNFFVVTDEDLEQAGVYLGYFHSDETKNPQSAIDENNESNQVV
jgi:hypothetical protein